MNAERIQKAEKLVAEGKKHLSTGLFKWKPDVDSAIECFDKGKLIFFRLQYVRQQKSSLGVHIFSFFLHCIL